MYIISIEENLANRWVARVQLNGEAAFFKFLHCPTNEEVLSEAERFHAAKLAAQSEKVVE
jgi:hypothetical protein